MPIQLLVDGRNFGKNHGASFAVILCSQIKGKKRHLWEKSFSCEHVTTNQACLQGILYAFHSVKKDNRADEVELIFKNKWVHGILERKDGEWVRESNANKDLVESVRKVFLEYSNIKIMSDTDSKLLESVRNHSSNLAKKNKVMDSKQ